MRVFTNVPFTLLVLGSLLVAGGIAAGCGSSTDDLTQPAGDAGTGDTGTPSNDTRDAEGNGSSDNEAGSGPSDGGNEGGPGGDTTTLSCGTAKCSIPAQTCCLTNPPGPGPFAFSCATGACTVVDGGNGGERPTSLKCSSQANCAAGTVCCVSSNNQGTRSECRATCGGGTGGGGGDTAQLCDPKAAAGTSGCPQSRPCSSNNIDEWRLPESFGTCGGVGN